MSNLPLVALRELNNAGTAGLAGGTMGFYVSGTSTPKAVYSDAARTSPLTNPVEADANGRFPTIYMIPGEAYTVELKDSAGVSINSEDGVYATLLTSDDYLDRIKQLGSNPLDYGAVGDGTNDESSEVQQAIDYVEAAGGGVVNLLGLIYRCDSTLTLPSNVELAGPGTLNFSNCADEEYIKIQGTLGTPYNLSSNAAYRASSVSASSSGIATGDLVIIKSTQTVANSVDSGELAEIVSVSGTTHNLRSPLHDDYNTADTAQIQEITPKEDVVIRDLEIVCSEAASGSAPSVIYAERARNLTVRRVRISGVKSKGIDLRQCINTLIESVVVQAGTNGTAVDVSRASRDTVINKCKFARVSTGVNLAGGASQNGGPLSTRIHHNDFYKCDTAINADNSVTRCWARWNRFDMCPSIVWFVNDGALEYNEGVDDGAIAITIPGDYVDRSSRPWALSVSHNTFAGSASIESTVEAISGGSGTIPKIKIDDNEGLLGLDVSIDWTSTTGVTCTKLHITRNRGDGTIAVDLSDAQATVDRLVLYKNEVDGISVTDGGVGTLNHVECDRNIIENGTETTLIDIICASGQIYVRDNLLEGDGANTITGINTDGGSIVHVTGNTVRNLTTGAWGILVEDVAASSTVKCVGNDVKAASRGIYLDLDGTPERVIAACNSVEASAGHAIRVDSADGAKALEVVDNTTKSAGAGGEHCLYVIGFWDAVTISDNTFRRDNDTHSNIHLQAATVGDITNVSLSGNNLTNGTFGVEFTNGDGNCWWSGGQMSSMLAGEFFGAVGRRVLYEAHETAFNDTFTSVTLDTISLPANLLLVGDVLRIRATAIATNDSGGTLAATAARMKGDQPTNHYDGGGSGVSVPNADAAVFETVLELTIVSDTVAHVHCVHRRGVDSTPGTDNAGVAAPTDLFNVYHNSSDQSQFTRTGDRTIDVKASWSGADAAAKTKLTKLTVELLREGT